MQPQMLLHEDDEAYIHRHHRRSREKKLRQQPPDVTYPHVASKLHDIQKRCARDGERCENLSANSDSCAEDLVTVAKNATMSVSL